MYDLSPRVIMSVMTVEFACVSMKAMSNGNQYEEHYKTTFHVLLVWVRSSLRGFGYWYREKWRHWCRLLAKYTISLLLI